MQKNWNESVLDNDLAASSLIKILVDNATNFNINTSYIYHNFPLYRDEEELSSRANILIISKNHGIILFECSDVSERVKGLNEELLKIQEQLEQTNSQIYSKLVKSKLLRGKKNKLTVELSPIIFLPNIKTLNDTDEFLCCNSELSIKKILEEISDESDSLDDNIFKEIVAIIEGSKGIIKPKERQIEDSEKQWKGALIQKVELDIANFDKDQKRAALNILKGPQRIRGLAGSGKTIILTWKAALIHLQDPEAEIIYTYYTKSLNQLIKQLITRFYRQHSDSDPNWDKIKILHAWGGRSLPGVYSEVCSSNGITPIKFAEAQSLGGNPFDEVCKKVVKSNLRKECDYLLMDEAQDFPSSFYELCYLITNNGSIVWGYDECQNILDIEIQDTVNAFGVDKNGKARVDLNEGRDTSRNDIVLHQCYRNPRNVLHIAFALGFGLYNKPILQMLENNEHWADLGFKVLEGNSVKGDSMKIERPSENSSLILNDKFINHENILVHPCKDPSHECTFVFEAIKKDIAAGLRPDDILVICIDDMYTKKYFDVLEKKLTSEGINVFNLQNAAYNSTVFKHDGYVTLSTVYKAKGNESASVYIIGIDNAFRTKDSIRARNKIFTAITRTKCWVTITGCGEVTNQFQTELNLALSDFPYFKFKMPDMKLLKKFQRDLSDSQSEMNRIEKEMEMLAKKRGISLQDLLLEFESNKAKK